MSQSIPGKPVFPALPRLSSRGSTHTRVARGTALCENLVGKPRGEASRESHRTLDRREGKRDTAATAREERARACPHSRRALTPLGILKKFPDIPVSTREEARESRPHPEEPRFVLPTREEGSFPCVVGKEFLAFKSQLKRRRSSHER